MAVDDRPLFSSRYRVGVEQVDREHERLFGIVGDVYDALGAAPGETAARARIAVQELLGYTRTHFTSEEGLMASCGFPELDAHRELHAELLGQVQDMEMRVELEGDAAALEISRFLADWLTEHIQVADRRFGDFVAARAGTPTRR